MGAYIIRRLLSVIPITLGVMLITFILFRVMGGNPAYRIAGKAGTAEKIAQISHARGFSKPILFGFRAQEWFRAGELKGVKEQSKQKKLVYDFTSIIVPAASSASNASSQFLVLDPSADSLYRLRFHIVSAPVGGVVTVYDLAGERLVEQTLPGQKGAGAKATVVAVSKPLPAPKTTEDSAPIKRGFRVEWNGDGASVTEVEVSRIQSNPFDAQLWVTMGHLIQFDFGESRTTKQQISTMIGEGLAPSLCVTVPILLIDLLLTISVALLAAYYRDSWLDRSFVIVAVMAMSISSLVYIMIAQYWLASQWKLFPVWGFESPRYLLLPVLIGVVGSMGSGIRFYRTIMLDEINQDYVRTARAKGVALPSILFRHVLRNAMIPILTNVIISIAFLYAGALLLENFFGIPGLGRMAVMAISDGDENVIFALTYIGSIIFVIANLVTDIAYTWADPRIRLK